MFIYFKDHGVERWVNINKIIYFNGDHMFVEGGKLLSIDKEYIDKVKDYLYSVGIV